MPLHITRRQAMRFGTLALSAPVGPAWAQNSLADASHAWPQKPLRIVVPGGAAGVVDIRARWLAERLQAPLGQTISIDNRPAAGGNLAMQAVARSAPDGYTLVMMHLGTMAVNPFLYDSVGYDPLKDFVAITRVGVGPLALTVNTGSPLRSVQDLLQQARSQPGALFYGSPGVGTPPHLASLLFLRSAGVEAIHVPFTSPTQASIELQAGRLSFTMEGLPLAMPMVKAGRLRALAVTGAQRFAGWPDVPTLTQSGLTDCEFSGWTGLAAPARTPAAVIQRLYAEISKVLTSAEGRQWFADLGNEVGNESPEATAALVRADHAKWGALIKAAGLRLQ
jgi:tripartite-type tricarboxylate transporter receptor subunit TctC